MYIDIAIIAMYYFVNSLNVAVKYNLEYEVYLLI